MLFSGTEIIVLNQLVLLEDDGLRKLLIQDVQLICLTLDFFIFSLVLLSARFHSRTLLIFELADICGLTICFLFLLVILVFVILLFEEFSDRLNATHGQV